LVLERLGQLREVFPAHELKLGRVESLGE